MARTGGKDRGIVEKPRGSGKWWARIFTNGRERWYRCDNKTQAKALHGRLRGEIREEKFFPEKFSRAEDITLRAWIARYLEGSTNRGAVNERRYGRFWSLLLGKRLISDITTEDLRRIQAKMKAAGRRAGATINRHFSFLRHVLQIAVKDGKLTRNPIGGIKFFPEAIRTRFLLDDEIKRLQGVMDGEDFKRVAFAINTGLRREEQFSLRWDQVDLENRVLTIPLPKGGRTRHVPLNWDAIKILRSLNSLLCPWVFPRPSKPLLPCSAQTFVNKAYTPALRQAGILGVCWHTLRHTAASRMVAAGVDLYAIKEILGHRDIQTTMRYAHLSPGYLHEAINRIGIGTGSKTGSDGQDVLEEISQPIENNWLGDEDSNLGRQSQSLPSCR
jgi:integrase